MRELLIISRYMIIVVFKLAAMDLLRILAMSHIPHYQPKAKEDISFLDYVIM